VAKISDLAKIPTLTLSSSPRVKFGEPGLDLLPEEAISTSSRTLLASLGMADPGMAGRYLSTLWT